MNNKININDFVYLLSKKLGYDSVTVSEYIDKYLEKKHRNVGRYIKPNDLVYLRNHFLEVIDISLLNPLDYASFLKGTNKLLEKSCENYHATRENNRVDPVIRTVIFSK